MSSSTCCGKNQSRNDAQFNNVVVAETMKACCVKVANGDSAIYSAVNELVDTINVENVKTNILNMCVDNPPGTLLVTNHAGEMVCFPPTGASPGDVLTYNGTDINWDSYGSSAYHLNYINAVTNVVPNIDYGLVQNLPALTPTNILFTTQVASPSTTSDYSYNNGVITITNPGNYQVTANVSVINPTNDTADYTAYLAFTGNPGSSPLNKLTIFASGGTIQSGFPSFRNFNISYAFHTTAFNNTVSLVVEPGLAVGHAYFANMSIIRTSK